MTDGEQHESIKNYHFCRTEEENIKYFNKQKYHDKIKDDYCKANKIKLLRISYKDVEDGTFKKAINDFIGV